MLTNAFIKAGIHCFNSIHVDCVYWVSYNNVSSMATNNETECLKIIEGREEEREREGQTDAVLIIKGKRERERQTDVAMLIANFTLI